MLETSPLLGGSHYNRINGTLNNNGRTRRKSSLQFLLFLTVLSAIVTYIYDENLSSYNNIGEEEQQSSSRVGSSINPDALRAASAGSTVDATYGYMISNEQRELARTLNVEKRVSICLYSCYLILALDAHFVSNSNLCCPFAIFHLL